MSNAMNGSTSERLERVRNINSDSLTLGSLVAALHEGGFGLVLIILAAPLALPVPALGIAQIMALPILWTSIQLFLGRDTLWLPKSWENKPINHKSLVGVIDKIQPWLHRLEYLIKPRIEFLSSNNGKRFIGFVCIICSISIAIPVPFSNTVPSMGVVLMAIGLLERDGILQILGAVIGLIGIALVIGIYFFAANTILNFVF